MKRKIIIGLLLAVFGYTASSAQDITVSLAGTFNGNTSTNKGFDNRSAQGYQLGLGYRYFLAEQWSLGTGLTYQVNRLDFIQRNNHGSWSSVDIEADAYEFRYHSKNRKEQLSYNTIQIPLTLQYETKGLVSWYVQTGVALGIITGNSSSRASMNDLHTSGYYPAWDVELTGPTFMGYGEFQHVSEKKDLSLKNRYSWLFETGVKQKLGEKSSLYIGAIVDLGLNDLVKESNRVEQPIGITTNYDSPLEFHSIWKQENFKTQKLKDYYVGIKLSYSFNL